MSCGARRDLALESGGVQDKPINGRTTQAGSDQDDGFVSRRGLADRLRQEVVKNFWGPPAASDIMKRGSKAEVSRICGTISRARCLKQIQR